MLGKISPFGRRAAAPERGLRSASRRLRPAMDTILSRPQAPAQPSRGSAGPGRRLPLAAALLVATSLVSALQSRVLLIEGPEIGPGRFWMIAAPLIAGLAAVIAIAARNVDRGRALAAITIVALLCPLLAVSGGSSGSIGLTVLLASAIAFAALPIALDWIASAGALTALAGGVLAAAPTVGAILGYLLPGALPSEPVSPGWSIALLILLVPVCAAAARLGHRPGSGVRPNLAVAAGQLTGNRALLGLMSAVLVAAFSGQLLIGLFQAMEIAGDASRDLVPFSQIGGPIAMVLGGLLADRRGQGQRGYAVWVTSMFGLSGLAVLASQSSGEMPLGASLMLAHWLSSASIGAALALTVRLVPAAARLAALVIFGALRFLGAFALAPLLQARLVEGGPASVSSLGATGLIVAAAIITATQPTFQRRG